MKKSIGLDLSPPKATCTDVKCPWHGKLPVRGKAYTATVSAAKSTKTAILEWGYNRFVPKYERYERRNIRITAYNPDCIKAREGDRVMIAECRPLSKTKSFVVVGVVK